MKIRNKDAYVMNIKIASNLEQIIDLLNSFKEYDEDYITKFDLNDHIDPAITLIADLVKKLNRRAEECIEEEIIDGVRYSR